MACRGLADVTGCLQLFRGSGIGLGKTDFFAPTGYLAQVALEKAFSGCGHDLDNRRRKPAEGMAAEFTAGPADISPFGVVTERDKGTGVALRVSGGNYNFVTPGKHRRGGNCRCGHTPTISLSGEPCMKFFFAALYIRPGKYRPHTGSSGLHKPIREH